MKPRGIQNFFRNLFDNVGFWILSLDKINVTFIFKKQKSATVLPNLSICLIIMLTNLSLRLLKSFHTSWLLANLYFKFDKVSFSLNYNWVLSIWERTWKSNIFLRKHCPYCSFYTNSLQGRLICGGPFLEELRTDKVTDYWM